MGLFSRLFKKTSPKNHIGPYLGTIEGLFEELEEVFMKKKRISSYLVDLDHKEEEIKRFQALDKEDIEKLNALARQAKDIEDKKQNLKGRLIKNNRALFLISQYEEDLPQLIQEMYASEGKQKETERNIFYLQEEKEDLLEEREMLLKGYDFLKKFSIVFVIILALCVVMVSALMQILRDEVWIFLGLIGVLMLVFLVGILYSRDRLDRGLRDNVILQQKAVRYLNQAKISYFHQTRYLDFQYEKLGVDSVAKLEMYYNRYIKNKDNEKNYLQLNRVLSEVEEKMLEVLKNKNIHLDYIEHLSDWIITPKKVNAIKALNTDKEKTREQLEALNTYEETLWKEIFVIQEEKSMEPLIAHKIKEYEERSKRLLDKIKEDA